MIRNVIGAILFTIAVFAFVNLVGELAIPTHTASTPAAPEPDPEPEPAPEPEPVVEAAPAPAPAPAPTTPVAEAVAAATASTDPGGDIAKGKKTFRKKCMSCHTIDKGGKDRTGPNLWAIVGRTKAASQNYRYSNTMKMLGGVWTEAEIGSFIAGPRTFVPDTKMTFAGLKKAQDRADVLAYLKTLTD